MKFDELFQSSVRDALSHVLGEDVFQAFIYLSRLDMSSATPKDVHEHLLPIFKDRGTQILEKIILRDLYNRIDRPYREKDVFDFVESIEDAKRVFTHKP